MAVLANCPSYDADRNRNSVKAKSNPPLTARASGAIGTPAMLKADPPAKANGCNGVRSPKARFQPTSPHKVEITELRLNA